MIARLARDITLDYGIELGPMQLELLDVVTEALARRLAARVEREEEDDDDRTEYAPPPPQSHDVIFFAPGRDTIMVPFGGCIALESITRRRAFDVRAEFIGATAQWTWVTRNAGHSPLWAQEEAKKKSARHIWSQSRSVTCRPQPIEISTKGDRRYGGRQASLPRQRHNNQSRALCGQSMRNLRR